MQLKKYILARNLTLFMFIEASLHACALNNIFNKKKKLKFVYLLRETLASFVYEINDKQISLMSIPFSQY